MEKGRVTPAQVPRSEHAGQADYGAQSTGLATRIRETQSRQQRFFDSAQTYGYEFRRRQLERLRKAVVAHEDALLKALRQDLGKSDIEAYTSELALVKNEITFALKHLKRWMKPQKVGAPLVAGLSRSMIYPEPRGMTLIMSPWNYPVLLTLLPLVGALAAGNCMVVKASENAPATAQLLTSLLRETFDERHVSVFEGGIEMGQALLKAPWDFIFYTGGTQVGRNVAAAAAEHLTPCILELGGRSPCIITAQANLDVAVRRLVFGKFLNAGQSCVAPNHLYVESSVHERVLALLKHELLQRYGTNPQRCPDYSRVINERHYSRLVGYLDHEPGRIAFGGQRDEASRFLAPTLLDPIDESHPVMQEEIFGPILPILVYHDLDEVVSSLNTQPHPLALYMFSEKREEVDRIMKGVRFGGGCVNDTMIHLANPRLPFGGLRDSGLGAYRGYHSFQAFSHQKSVVHSSTLADPMIRYLPFTPLKKRLYRWLIG
jgi:aldehyde dehydrogenase (NAD+)